MRKVLTAKTIEALKPREKRYEVRDAYFPGFAVRIGTTGARIFRNTDWDSSKATTS